MITYKIGDVIQATVDMAQCIPLTNFIIPHICNNKGGWGAGFVLAISKRWKRPEEQYKKWAARKDNFELGCCQLVQVENNIQICNMVAQDNFSTRDKPRAVSYDALEICLSKLNKSQEKEQVTFMLPRIGCGLGGGNWQIIEAIINKTLWAGNIYVYDLK